MLRRFKETRLYCTDTNDRWAKTKLYVTTIELLYILFVITLWLSHIVATNCTNQSHASKNEHFLGNVDSTALVLHNKLKSHGIH